MTTSSADFPSGAMRAAVLTEPNVIDVEERPVPRPLPGEVPIRVASVGVCGSDVRYYREGRIGSFVVDAPPAQAGTTRRATKTMVVPS